MGYDQFLPDFSVAEINIAKQRAGAPPPKPKYEAHALIRPTRWGFGRPIFVKSVSRDHVPERGERVIRLRKSTVMWYETTFSFDAQTSRNGRAVNPVRVSPYRVK